MNGLFQTIFLVILAAVSTGCDFGPRWGWLVFFIGLAIATMIGSVVIAIERRK